MMYCVVLKEKNKCPGRDPGCVKCWNCPVIGSSNPPAEIRGLDEYGQPRELSQEAKDVSV